MADADAARLEARLALWMDGIGDESPVWDSWLAGSGLQWVEEHARRLDPGAPLVPLGAGPVTDLGYRLAGLDPSVDATDPLAPLYAALLARHGGGAAGGHPVRPRRGPAPVRARSRL